MGVVGISAVRAATVALVACVVGVAAACGAFDEAGGGGPEAAPDATAPVVPGDAGVPADGGRLCSHATPFEAPEEVTELGPPGSQLIAARLMPNERVVYFGRSDLGRSDRDLWVAFRNAATEPFGTPQKLERVSTTQEEGKPTFTETRQRLYFHRNSAEAPTLYAVWVAEKDPALSDFLSASKLGGGAVNLADGGASSTDPFVSEDETELFFTSTREGGPTKPRIWRATGPGDGSFGQAAPVSTTSDDDFQNAPVLSSDGLALYFGTGAPNATKIVVLARSSRGEPFSLVRALDELNSSVRDEPSWLSPDNCRLYFYSDRGGSFRIYRASRSR